MVCMFRKIKDVKHHPTTEKKMYKEILHFCGLWTKKGNLQETCSFFITTHLI